MIAAPAPTLTVDGVLESLGRLENELLRGCDLNGLAGSRIAALTRCTDLHFEFAKAWEVDFLACGRCCRDLGQNPVHDGLGLGLGEGAFACQVIDQVSRVH